jgi:phosphate-selective porin OprO/OprP
MGFAVIMGISMSPARAQSADQQSADQKIQQLEERVDELDQQIKIDERKKELDAEDAAAKAQNGATATADTSGFTIKSNDGNFLLKIGADLQVDNRAFLGQGASAGSDGMLLRRVRPTISGTVYKYVDYFAWASSSLPSVSNACNRMTIPPLSSAACPRCWSPAATSATRFREICSPTS